MGEHENFLITILQEEPYTHLRDPVQGTLLRCALQVVRSDTPMIVVDHPMERESRRWLRDKLPTHVKDYGPIVQVERIFEIATA